MIKLLLIVLSLTAGAMAQDIPSIGPDLSLFDEDKNLRPGKKARLFAVVEEGETVDYSKEPMILVHGIRGNPEDMQVILNHYRGTAYQPYVLAYADFKRRTSLNGEDFHEELMTLKQVLPESAGLVIIAHSMGGIVSRKALSLLQEDNGFGSIRCYTADTPWHGFDGPGDHGIDGVKMKFASVFLPEGLIDMRAKSDFLKQQAEATLASNIELDIVFATSGDQASDHTEFSKKTEEALKENYWKTLNSTSQLGHPRFEGDHMTVIQPKDYNGSYLEHLDRSLQNKKARD